MNNGHRYARCCRAARALAACCKARRRPCTLDQLARSEREAWKTGACWRQAVAGGRCPQAAAVPAAPCAGVPALLGPYPEHGPRILLGPHTPAGCARRAPARPAARPLATPRPVCASLCVSAGVRALCAAARRCQRASCLARPALLRLRPADHAIMRKVVRTAELVTASMCATLGLALHAQRRA